MSNVITNELLSPISSKRVNKEKLFKLYGIAAIFFAMSMLIFLLITISYKGFSAFYETRIKLDIYFNEELIDPLGNRESKTLYSADYSKVISQSLFKSLNINKEDPKSKEISKLVTYNSFLIIRDHVLKNSNIIGETKTFNLIASDDVDQMLKGNIDINLTEENRKITDYQIEAIEKLKSNGNISKVFNKTFFTSSDSREPEVSGILGSMIGSFYCLLVALLISVPLGVSAAIYLQEFAKKNKFTDFIEININNLAAVPSIVFGLLGLSVFINFFGLPRSTPLVGGLVLALMSLPTIVIEQEPHC